MDSEPYLLEYEAYVPMASKPWQALVRKCDSSGLAPCAPSHIVWVRLQLQRRASSLPFPLLIELIAMKRAAIAIERLKQIVPIWKKEIWEDGSEWKGSQTGPWNPLQTPKDE